MERKAAGSPSQRIDPGDTQLGLKAVPVRRLLRPADLSAGRTRSRIVCVVGTLCARSIEGKADRHARHSIQHPPQINLWQTDVVHANGQSSSPSSIKRLRI